MHSNEPLSEREQELLAFLYRMRRCLLAHPQTRAELEELLSRYEGFAPGASS